MSDELLDLLRDRAARRGPTEGQQAAACFELFKKGKDLNQIVQQLSLTPEFVRRMYREHLRSLKEDAAQKVRDDEVERDRRRVKEERQFDRSLDAARDLARWYSGSD